MNRQSPSEQLATGAAILQDAVAPFGFTFESCGNGIGSGGPFAYGHFVRDERRIELYFRQSLGGVAYHMGTASVHHEPYMRFLGVWGQCRYPGFSKEDFQVFHDLAHDLQFASDFLCGSGSSMLKAARIQNACDDERNEFLLAGYQGQSRLLDAMRRSFKAGKYAEVVKAFRELPAPHLLTDAELRLVTIARRRNEG